MTLYRQNIALCFSILLFSIPSFSYRQNTGVTPSSFTSNNRNTTGKSEIWSDTPSNRRHFVVYSEKRHKEAIWGRKYTSTGTSSQKRHHRIVGRGGGLPRRYKVSGMPTKKMEHPARKCMLLGKMDNTKARQISHSGKRTHRKQKVNLQWRRIWCISKGHYVRLRLSMKGLKTIKRLGLEEAAQRFHLNLNNPKLFAGYANIRKKRERTMPEFTETYEDVSINS